MAIPAYTVVDLFSGGGGMSYGFHAHPAFRLVGAVDAQLGKPSSRRGSLACNSTYALNMGFDPIEVDLVEISPDELATALGVDRVDVLSACPPCTGFSRTNSRNHLVDDVRNALVPRVALFAERLEPSVIVMENARELLAGNFRGHFSALESALERIGYTVRADVHMLSKFGLPQVRERGLIVATRRGLTARTLGDLWDGYHVVPEATTVKHAVQQFGSVAAGDVDPSDRDHVSPRFASRGSFDRIKAIPADGGSWRDLVGSA